MTEPPSPRPPEASRQFAAPITGREIVSLMRRSGLKIAELSSRMGITMKRIREVRSQGLSDPNTIRDWIEAITGQDPGHIR
jgi:hypothetical protein